MWWLLKASVLLHEMWLQNLEKGKKSTLTSCLHDLEHSIIDYLLNSLDDILWAFLLLLFVLTVVTQLTSLKEKPDSSQEWHRREVLGYLESQRLNDLNDSYKPLFFDR